MIITRVIGDCPTCGAKNSFGNVFIHNNSILRECIRCSYHTTIPLPKIRKKIIYIDQFFFSTAFQDKDKRFVEAANKIRHLSDLQLLVAPFSSIHEDETHQWTGYGGKDKEGLMEFIKATSRGHEFEFAYCVKETQILKAFNAFLAKSSTKFICKENEVIKSNVHEWDDYFRIDISRYIGDIKLIGTLKRQSIEGLVSLFESWRTSTDTFDQDVSNEIQGMRDNYFKVYYEFVDRLAKGDFNAYFDAPIASGVIEAMSKCFSNGIEFEKRLKIIDNFFASEYFAQIPYTYLSARIFARLKDMVKGESYTNYKKTMNRLSGFFYDVSHIATYAPYCDAFIMDNPMAALISDSRVGLEDRYGIKVFSPNRLDKLLEWLDTIETEMTEEHKVALSAIHPHLAK